MQDGVRGFSLKHRACTPFNAGAQGAVIVDNRGVGLIRHDDR